jgi:ferredoxin
MCPEFVFMTYPRKCRLPGRRAKDWVIVPVHLTLCTGYMVCVEACPQNAITITLDAEDLLREKRYHEPDPSTAKRSPD